MKLKTIDKQIALVWDHMIREDLQEGERETLDDLMLNLYALKSQQVREVFKVNPKEPYDEQPKPKTGCSLFNFVLGFVLALTGTGIFAVFQGEAWAAATSAVLIGAGVGILISSS